MAGSISDLATAFQKAVDAFNAHDPTIGGYLDKNVVVFSVHKPGHMPADGIAAAVNYFTADFKDDPTFNVQGSPSIEVNDNGESGTSGSVSGTAQWNDKHGPDTLKFIFKFVFDDGNGWRLLSIWGRPVRDLDSHSGRR